MSRLPLLLVLALAVGCTNDRSEGPGGNYWPDAGDTADVDARDGIASDANESGDSGVGLDPRLDTGNSDAGTDADELPDSGDARDLTDARDTNGVLDVGTDTDAMADTPSDTAEDTPDGDVPDTSATPVGCVTEVGAGHHILPCDADIRFDVEVPEACLGGGCGVIVDVHGLSMDADQQDRNTNMRARGREYGYLVVQPNAPNRAWNGGQHDGAVWGFLQDVVNAYHADRDRLHFMGFSQGADMTLRMLCAHADELGSVAPAATNGLDCPELPSAEIAILHLHGTADVLYNFGLAERLRDRVIEHWNYGEGQVIADDPAHRAWRHRSAAATVYEFHAHDFRAESGLLGGHCFPGSPDTEATLPNQLFPYACLGEDQFDYAALAMAFFLAHPAR